MNRYNIDLLVKFGSEFQEECFEKIVPIFLQTLKSHFDNSHKGNEVHFKIEIQKGKRSLGENQEKNQTNQS